jgi:hypothetical protein
MRPTVFLFSEPGAFSLYLLEKLLSNLCRVVVFSAKPNAWQKFTQHIAKSSNLIFDLQKNYSKYPKPNYFLIVNLLNIPFDELINKANALSETLSAKGFVVVAGDKVKKTEINLNDAVGVISLDNLFGPRMELDGSSRISQIIGYAVRNEAAKIYDNEKISPVYIGDAAKLIVKWLFSFGPYGEIAYISSPRVSLEEVCEVIKKVYTGFKYHVVRGNVESPDFGKKNIYVFEGSSNRLLEENLLWFKRNVRPEEVMNKKRGDNRVILVPLFSALVILAAPYILILASVLFLLLSKEAATKENFSLARFFVDSSYVSSNIAGGESRLLGRIPVLGRPYVTAGSVSYIIKNTSSVGSRSFDLISEVYALSNNILSGSEYGLVGRQEKIASNLTYIETTLSFIESELKNYPKIYKKIDISQLRKFALNAKKIVISLSDLLGVDKTKTYLVLFQNNMELRPTGGFIGSFALVSFTSGKLDQISVQDVYSADGQLKGHVEPPTPIKKYLNEANWFLRDSNWDPNFPVSAQRAEWFLDKEIDVSVDGVIAVDLNVIKDLLNAVGPIYLSDYQTQISSDNFYEKTQSEVEGNFFPGSTKKASFITALTKEMMNNLVQNKESKAKLAEILYNNLDARHIQIFLHNNLAKEALSDLNWDGAFNYSACSGNCYSDLLSLIEANLGVNKSNYYIERNYNLSVNLNEGVITKNLSVIYKNTANPAMGNMGIYKNYSRLIVPLSSVLQSIKVGDLTLVPDIENVAGRKEIGFYFELSPGQTKTLNISWQITQPLTLTKTGEYLMYIRKQAGTGGEPISINISAPSGVALIGVPSYNTLFAKDIISKITWKK